MADLALTRLRWPAVLACQEPWERLRATAPTEAPFLSTDWLETWWRHLGPGGDPSILAVRRGSEVVALAPLYRSRIGPAGPVVLRPMAAGVSDYLDLILPRDGWDRRLSLMTLVDGLLERRGWDALDLVNLPAESPTVAALRYLAACRGLPVAELPGRRRPGIGLDGSWDRFLGSRPGKARYNLRSRLRRLEGRGPVRFRSVTTLDELGPALAALTALHARRWAGQRTSTIFSASLRGRAFYAEACRRYARRGLLDLTLLELDGRPIAGCLSFVERATFYYYMPAWDPDLAAYAPSTLLLAHLIERAFDRGLERFDFMLGEEEYKAVWATEERSTLRLLVGRRGPRGRLAVASLASLHAARQRARASATLRRVRRYGPRALLSPLALLALLSPLTRLAPARSVR